MKIVKDADIKLLEYAFYILPDEIFDFYFIFSKNDENKNIKLETILYYSKLFDDVFLTYTDNGLITLPNILLNEKDLQEIINFVKQNNHTYYFDYLKDFDEDYYVYTKYYKDKQIYVYVLKDKPFHVFIDLLYSSSSLISTLINKDLLLIETDGVFIDRELVYTKLKELEREVENILSLEQKRKIKDNPNLIPVKKAVYNSKLGKTYFQTFYVRKDGSDNKLNFNEFKTNIKDILNYATVNNFESKIITEISGKQDYQIKTKGNSFQVDNVVKINDNDILSLARTDINITNSLSGNKIKINHRKIYNKDVKILEKLLERYKNNPILQKGLNQLFEKLGNVKNALNKEVIIEANINKTEDKGFAVEFRKFWSKNNRATMFKLFNEFMNILIHTLKSENIQITLNRSKVDVGILNILSILYLKEKDIYESLKDRDVRKDLQNMKNSIKKLYDVGVINRVEYVILNDIHKTYSRIINSISKQYHERMVEEKLFSTIIEPINYEGVSIAMHLLGNWFGSRMLYTDLFNYSQFFNDINDTDDESKTKRIEKKLIYNKNWKKVYEFAV